MKKWYNNFRCLVVVFLLVLGLCLQTAVKAETISSISKQAVTLSTDSDEDTEEEEDEGDDEDDEDEDDEEDNTPVRLEAPKLKSIKSTYQGVMLKWSEVEEADSYTVIRNGKKIATTRGCSFLDSNPKGGVKNNYQIIADGDEEDYLSSNATIAKTDKLPKKVTKLVIGKGKASKKMLALSWAKVSGAKSYIVLRSTSKKGIYKKIATVKKNRYTRKKGKKIFFYKVVAKTKKLYSPASTSIKG